MKIIGNTIYNDEAAPSSERQTRPRTGMYPTSPFHSAYRSPDAKGLGELTYNSYSRLHARVMRGMLKNLLFSLLLIAALMAVAVSAFLAKYEGGYSDILLVIAAPILCIAAIMYVALGVINDTKADIARLRREKKRLSRSAKARLERESGKRRLSVLLTLAGTAALLAALNMLPIF